MRDPFELKVEVVEKEAPSQFSVKALQYKGYWKEVGWCLYAHNHGIVIEPRYNREDALYLNTKLFDYKLTVDIMGATILIVTPRQSNV